MKKFGFFGLYVSLLGAALAGPNTLVVTASNTATNQLLVYNSTGQLIQAVPTQGAGGAGGNAGGIEASGHLLAVVSFGSQSVTIFERGGRGFTVKQVVRTASKPLSVAFGHDHLYILGTTTVESHRISGSDVAAAPDGVVTLLVADGSSAQVGVVQKQLVITEKSNVIETVSLLPDGPVSGVPTKVQNIPANVNTPFGLFTRGNDAWVTIAHADEISLVRDGEVLTTTSSGTQHSPCWLTLSGSFLYSANSPSHSISRFVVFGRQIVQDQAVAAQVTGNPTDIASGDGLLAVIDGVNLSIFRVDDDGNLSLQSKSPINSVANGVAVLSSDN